jgi:hypothetical protein
VTAATRAVQDANDPDSAERARLLRKTSVHGQGAVKVFESLPINAADRGDVRQRLAGRQIPGATPVAAALEYEIETPERIIAWQINTVGWTRPVGFGTRQPG